VLRLRKMSVIGRDVEDAVPYMVCTL
jgi:hypothetical protein